MKVEEVRAYRCGECKTVHAVNKDAAKCCTCEKCGAPVTDHRGLRDSQCAACREKTNKRYARDRVKRAKKDLEFALANLASYEKKSPT